MVYYDNWIKQDDTSKEHYIAIIPGRVQLALTRSNARIPLFHVFTIDTRNHDNPLNHMILQISPVHFQLVSPI